MSWTLPLRFFSLRLSDPQVSRNTGVVEQLLWEGDNRL